MTARELAFLVLRDTFGEPPRGAQASFDYRAEKSQLDDRDRAFAAELCYGTMKSRRLLDWRLRPYLGARHATLPFSISEILRMGVYQIREMTGVEDHAAVSETVGLASRYGHRGTAGLVNAVLRRIIRETPPDPVASDFESEADYLGVRYSLPTWIVSRYIERFGLEKTQAIVEGLDTNRQIAAHVDLTRISLDEAAALIEKQGFTSTPSPFVDDVLLLAGRGRFNEPKDARVTLQSESAAMPVDILAPMPGESVLELCSGRGNKTLQLASRMRGQGTIESVELDERKCVNLRSRLAAAGVSMVNVINGDAVAVTGESVDAVMVDAPCTGLGILGRRPEARWRKSPDDAVRLGHLGFEILMHAATRVRSGGRMVFAVCSSDRRESDDVIDRFLAESNFTPAPIPEKYVEFSTEKAGRIIVPPGIDGRDGFFIAAFHRP